MAQERTGKLSSLNMDIVNRQTSGDLALQPQWRGGQTSPRGEQFSRSGNLPGAGGRGDSGSYKDSENGWNSEERAVADKDSGRFKPFFDPQARAQKWKEEDSRGNRRGYEEGFWGNQQDRWAGGRGRGRTGDDRWGNKLDQEQSGASRWERWDGSGPEWRSKTGGGYEKGVFNAYGEGGSVGRGRGRGRGTAFKGYGPGQPDKQNGSMVPKTNQKLFTRRELQDVYDSMLVQGGSQLQLQQRSRVDDLSLQADHGPHIVFSSEHNDEVTEEGDGIGGEDQPLLQRALAHNMWLYLDPQGQWQGPYPKDMILIWFNMNYFPDDLQLKSELDVEGAQIVQLKVLMGFWGPPPGFNADKGSEEEGKGSTPTKTEPEQQQDVQQESPQQQDFQPQPPDQVQPDPVVAPPAVPQAAPIRKIESPFGKDDQSTIPNLERKSDPVLASFSQAIGGLQGINLGPLTDNQISQLQIPQQHPVSPQLRPQQPASSFQAQQFSLEGRDNATWSPLAKKEVPESNLVELLQQQQSQQQQKQQELQQQQQQQQQQTQNLQPTLQSLLQGQQLQGLGDDPSVFQQQLPKTLPENQVGSGLLSNIGLQQQLGNQGIRDPILSQLLQQQLQQQKQQSASHQSILPASFLQQQQQQQQQQPHDLSSILAKNSLQNVPGLPRTNLNLPAQADSVGQGLQAQTQQPQQSLPTQGVQESSDRFTSARELLKILMPNSSQASAPSGNGNGIVTGPSASSLAGMKSNQQSQQGMLFPPHQQAGHSQTPQQQTPLIQSNELLQKLKPNLLSLLQQQEPLANQQFRLQSGGLQQLQNPQSQQIQDLLGKPDMRGTGTQGEMTPSKDLLLSLLPNQPQLPQNALLQHQQQQQSLLGGVQQSLQLQGKGFEQQWQQQSGLNGFQDGSQSMFLQRNVVDKPIDPPQKSQAPVGSQIVPPGGAQDPKLGWSTVQKGKTFAEIQAEQLKVGLGVGRVVQPTALNSQAGGQKMAWNASNVPAPQQTDVHKTFRDIQLEEERLHKQQQQLSVKQLNAKNEVTFAVSADGNAPRGGTLTDALEAQLKGRSVPSNLYEESAADLEGGADDDDDDIPRMIQPPRMKVTNFKLIQQQEEAARKKREAAATSMQRRQSVPEQSLLTFKSADNSAWGRNAPAQMNGLRNNSTGSQAPNNLGNFTYSPAHVGGDPTPTPAQLTTPSRSTGSWANKLKPNTPMQVSVESQTRSAQQHQQTQQQVRQQPQGVHTSPQLLNQQKQMQLQAQGNAQNVGQDGGIDEGQEGTGLMNEEFKSWCRQKMMELKGKDDLTLIEFLLTLQSNSEVAEYCSEYLGEGSKVSAFVSEFLKRRALDQQTQVDKKSRKGKKKRGKKQSGDKAAQDEDEADDDQNAGNKATTKPKGKKGEPVDKSQWGFRTVGSQFGLLATDE